MKKLGEYSKEEQVSLRMVICPDTVDPHIEYFLRCCDARGVDPFSNQMYLQVRNNKGKPRPAVAMTIDGARMQASRTGEYAGSDEPEYNSEDEKFPQWCRSTVYRMVDKERCAFTSKVRWDEFKPDPPNDFQWKAKPYHMLAKVGEMQALRKAFPESVSADSDEYADESKGAHETKKELSAAHDISEQQWSQAVKAFADKGVASAQMLVFVKKATAQDVTNEDMDQLRAWYEEITRAEVTP